MAVGLRFEGGRRAGVSRRQFLQTTAVGGTVLVLAPSARGGDGVATGPVERSLIHIRLAGGPSHLDTFDMKPGAPREIRGEFSPVSTNGEFQICQLLPRLARLGDRFSLIRSVTGLPDSHSSRAASAGWDPSDASWAGRRPGLAEVLATRGTGEGKPSAVELGPCDASGERVEHESDAVWSEYGIDRYVENRLFLQARRAVEAGARYVGFAWGFWDTHGNNFGQLRRQLPRLDCGLAALMRDLDVRGRLDEVMILMTGEFGRTPRINPGAGRDHWTGASTVFLAGGGLPHGQTIGATDAIGAEPVDRPLLMDDVLFSVYHLLGIDASKVAVVDKAARRPLMTRRPLLAELCGEAVATA